MADTWAPMRIPAFRRAWTAYFISQTGQWTQESSGLWYASGLSSRPQMVFHDGRGSSIKGSKGELGKAGLLTGTPA